MKSLITIAVCCFNEQESIALCIESILASYARCLDKSTFKLLIIDDGSTDNSFQIAQSFQRKYSDFVCVHKLPHKGLSTARQYAAHISDSNYILYFDADAVIDLNTLKSYEDFFFNKLNDKEAQVAFFGSVLDLNSNNFFYKYHYKALLECTPFGLIGANMCWDRSFLLENPFRAEFKSRGDESYLLTILAKKPSYSPPIFIHNAIVRNSFTSDWINFLKERFLNGRLNSRIDCILTKGKRYRKRFLLILIYSLILFFCLLAVLFSSIYSTAIALLVFLVRLNSSKNYILFTAKSYDLFGFFVGICFRVCGLILEDFGYLIGAY